MVVHTNHPIAAPPTAPPREKTSHLVLRGWCIFVIAAALAGTSWLMAFGVVGAGIVGLAHAYHAHNRGLSVAVIDHADGITGASVRNFGAAMRTAATTSSRPTGTPVVMWLH